MEKSSDGKWKYWYETDESGRKKLLAVKKIKMKYSYKPLPKNVTIGKSNIHGLGLFAVTDIPKGFDLGVSHYQLEEAHAIRTPLGGFINHSKTPNCTIKLKWDVADFNIDVYEEINSYLAIENKEVIKSLFKKFMDKVYSLYHLYPTQDIAEGEELTLDYTKEWSKIANKVELYLDKYRKYASKEEQDMIFDFENIQFVD